MPAHPVPENEAIRLRALRNFAVLDTAADARIDALTRLAARIYGTPIAMVSLVDEDRLWFMSTVGVPQGGSMARAGSFCAHAVLHPGAPLVVEDAANDPRFMHHESVAGSPGIRFYAGVALCDRDGLAIGTLCVADHQPRAAAGLVLDELHDLAAGVTAALELQRTVAELRQSDVFAHQVLSVSPNSINVLDLEGRVLFMNEACRRSLNLDPNTVIEGQSWIALWPETEQKRIQQQIETARTSGHARLMAMCPHGDGAPAWWDNTITIIPGTDAQPARLLSSSRDVTEAKFERDQLDAARAQLAAVLESTTDHVIVVDQAWTITYLNRHAANLVGDGRVLAGASLWDALPYGAGSQFRVECGRALAAGTAVAFEDYLPSRGLWLDVHAYPTADGLSIFFRDATERHRTQAQLVHLAQNDSLTGLNNRLVLHQRMSALVKTLTPFAVLLIDLDHFKEVNDTFGHPVGDALLQQAAARLRNSVRKADAVARVGGDEFAVLLTGPRHRQNAGALAERIVADFSIAFDIDGMALCCGASIGVAISADSCGDADGLLKDADLALYAAKAAGRSTYRFFSTDMAQAVAARQALKSLLREALTRQEMAVVYQPVVELGSNHIAGFEALLRWTCLGRGPVSPTDFIPIAEETGLITQIGKWALQAACRQAVLWPDPVWVAVNLSPVQFRDPGLVQAVAAALQAAGLPPRRLELEITETALLRDDDTTLSVLHALRGLGVRIALDDFGTGYASLSYLRSFPFDKIKIDRSFIHDLPGSAESAAIVRAVTSMGRSLALTITAEGVETQAQFEAVRLQGCGEGQGYYFSRPVPGDEAARLLKAPSLVSQAQARAYGRNTELLPANEPFRSRHI